MQEDKELVDMLRAVIQEEMQTVRQEVRTIVKEELQPVNEKLTIIEATVNDIRATNRRTHKELFSRLDYIVEDIKRLEPHEEKAVK